MVRLPPAAVPATPVVEGIAIPAQIVTRDESISPESRTRLYRALIQGNGHGLFHGGAVTVSVPVKNETPVFNLPGTALQTDSYGQFVYLISKTEDGSLRAVRQNLSDIFYKDDRVMVARGLETGMLVATDGAFKLYPGILVNVVEDLPVDTANRTAGE